jgi:CubicO group peptidase (beta-lactamase class C family)
MLTCTLGAFEYKKAFGNTIAKDGATNPLPRDATLIIASCTKLMTTIAALQCVERGLLELDSDISSILVEYKNIDILTGFDESTGKPVLKRAENYITLR